MPPAEADLRAALAGSFGAASALYERARPGYPEAALDWLLPAGSPRILDLGAGTGKLTRQIAGRGLEVVAVDPSAGMLAQLREVLPGVEAHQGTAEQIPLPDGAVDAVLVAQAWHWVDVPAASREVARVLAAGGHLGLVWNKRDERVPWVAELGRITDFSVPTMDASAPLVGPPFGELEEFQTEWSVPMSPASLVDLVGSRSAVIIASEAERDARIERIRRLLASDPELRGRDTFELPYVTLCYRARLR